jgi:hypothetical protein
MDQPIQELHIGTVVRVRPFRRALYFGDARARCRSGHQLWLNPLTAPTPA